MKVVFRSVQVMGKTELRALCIRFGGFPKLGVPFWGPSNKDYSILGSILGSPQFGKLPFVENLT